LQFERTVNRPMKNRSLALLSTLFPLLLLCGCYTAKMSEPPRTALEQLVLSRSSDLAMDGVDLSWVNGKKIYVEEKYFDSYDKAYVIGLIRQHLNEAGGLLMKADDKADLIVEIRSGGLGMDTSETMVGIPSLSIPVPLSGSLQTPEIAFYKNTKANAIAKFALFAYARDSGEFVHSVGPVSGYSHFHLYKLVGITWKRTDVQQLKKHPTPDHSTNSVS
jgi:hypothetical protein